MDKMKTILTIYSFIASITMVYGQNWTYDIKEAKEIANRESKPIIMVFQGSDWCVPCMKLDHEIWSQLEFKKQQNIT